MLIMSQALKHLLIMSVCALQGCNCQLRGVEDKGQNFTLATANTRIDCISISFLFKQCSERARVWFYQKPGPVVGEFQPQCVTEPHAIQGTSFQEETISSFFQQLPYESVLAILRITLGREFGWSPRWLMKPLFLDVTYKTWVVRNRPAMCTYVLQILGRQELTHDDVIKWKHFPRHWPFVRGIHRSPVNSPHKGQ